MKSFKDYANNTPEESPINEPSQEEVGATAEELTKKIAAAYHGRSSVDMLRNILAEAERGKREGTLSNEEIEAFYQNFSPMLSGFQRKKLREIVDRLKEI
ncbi:MAG: hypothetical protein IKD47_04985 [Clostridia bacterium]|nr:hypothetical protein [Clostridia bacterium]